MPNRMETDSARSPRAGEWQAAENWLRSERHRDAGAISGGALSRQHTADVLAMLDRVLGRS